MRESDSDSGSIVSTMHVRTTFWKRTKWYVCKTFGKSDYIRLNELYMKRRMELKGWITNRSAETMDLKIQWLRSLAMILTRWHLMSSKINRLEMYSRTNKERDQRKNHGKLVVQQRDQFSHRNCSYEMSWERSSRKVLKNRKTKQFQSRLESSPNWKSLSKTHVLFFQGLEEVKRDKSKIHVVYGKIQISFFVGSALAARDTPEGERPTWKGRDIMSYVIEGIRTEFSEPLFWGRRQLGLTLVSGFFCAKAVRMTSSNF